MAAGGTLFLDEIGDLRLDLQAKLLRAIQEGEIERVGGVKPIKADFRLIVATNVDLERAVRDGRFREDLYYRINVIPIRMPPLRERLEDLPMLVDVFIDALQRALPQVGDRASSDEAMSVLQALLVAGQRPRAAEPDRAARRGRRARVHRRGRSPASSYQLANVIASQPSSEGRFADAVNSLRAQC